MNLGPVANRTLRELCEFRSRPGAITKHGRRLAVLKPVSDQKLRDLAEVIAELREFRHGRKLGGLPVREMIEDGRR